jgi:molybdopterin/thiamine biosynthesis adenylyltransferase
MLSESERKRYARQLLMDGFGEPQQEKLARASVLVAGAGGLGCSVSLYLAAAGVGCLRIVDDGVVELSNLNRQIAYSDGDIGGPKVGAISRRIGELNREVRVESHQVRMDDGSLPRLVEGCDAVIDALDNLPTRYAVNRAALARGVPIVHGAALGFFGQVMTVIPGRTPCLMCLYRGRETSGVTPVIGVTPGVIGLLQAVEAIKLLAGLGKLLTGTLLAFDGLQMSFDELAIPRDPDCPACGHIQSPWVPAVRP